MERAGNVEFSRMIQGGGSLRFKKNNNKQDRNVFGKRCIRKGMIPFFFFDGGGGGISK